MIASSKIKTPTMDVPVFANPDCISQAQQLQKQLSKVYFSTVSLACILSSQLADFDVSLTVAQFAALNFMFFLICNLFHSCDVDLVDSFIYTYV